MGIVIDEDDAEKLNFLNEVLLASRSLRKATYSMWFIISIERRGEISAIPSRLCWPIVYLGSSYPAALKMG